MTESLTNLRQKLDEITGVSDVNLSINETNNLSVSTCEIPATTSYRAPLIPRSAYMEAGFGLTKLLVSRSILKGDEDQDTHTH